MAKTVLNNSKAKDLLFPKLESQFGEREATNIIAYYMDAINAGRHNESPNIEADLQLLLSGKPVQQVCHTAFFYGYTFYINDDVLIPRPETEELVHWIVTDLKSENNPCEVLDIGTGSGCILLSVMQKIKSASGTGLEISDGALKVFEKNALDLGLKPKSIRMNILDLSHRKVLPQYDVIVSNPPYILQSEKNRMGDNVIENEPHLALFVDGDDPLVFYKSIMAFAKGHLKNGGALYFETSDLYHEQLKEYCNEMEWNVEFRKDLQGEWRMVKLVNN